VRIDEPRERVDDAVDVGAPHLALRAMWAVMMTAMMLPSAYPILVMHVCSASFDLPRRFTCTCRSR
jgi:predicted metal-binding membrane protein